MEASPAAACCGGRVDCPKRPASDSIHMIASDGMCFSGGASRGEDPETTVRFRCGKRRAVGTPTEAPSSVACCSDRADDPKRPASDSIHSIASDDMCFSHGAPTEASPAAACCGGRVDCPKRPASDSIHSIASDGMCFSGGTPTEASPEDSRCGGRVGCPKRPASDSIHIIASGEGCFSGSTPIEVT